LSLLLFYVFLLFFFDSSNNNISCVVATIFPFPFGAVAAAGDNEEVVLNSYSCMFFCLSTVIPPAAV